MIAYSLELLFSYVHISLQQILERTLLGNTEAMISISMLGLV